MPISSVGLSSNWTAISSAVDQNFAQRRQVIQAAKTVNESGALGRNQLVFSVDSQTHRPIIRVEDRETHEVVLQIPPEYVIRLAENLGSGLTETTPHPSDM